MREPKVGDRVISDLDGLEYTITKIGPRNQLCGLRGVELVGDAVILEDNDGNEHMVYAWEVSLK